MYPSTWEEGFGISVVEAMARGCIPITFKKGGLVEIIQDGVNGFIVNNTESVELAEKIDYAINYKEKDEECDLNLVVNNAEKAEFNIAMSNSLGFGGHNSSIVMRKWNVEE